MTVRERIVDTVLVALAIMFLCAAIYVAWHVGAQCTLCAESLRSVLR